MSNKTKKFAGLESLQAFLDGCKTLFANITHKHTMSDITDSSTVLESYETKEDSQAKYDELSSEKKDKDIIVTYADSTRTTTTHTSQEIYAAINEGTTVYFNNGGTNFHYLEGASSVVNFYNCFYNNSVMQADVYEIRGNKITNTHFQSNIIKQSDIDTSVNKLKNDLLNGAGDAYDTLKELGDLIDENQDAIDALESIAVNKADKEHTHDEYETKEDAQAKYDELKESKPDWNENDSSSANYIENRTHWVGTGVGTKVLVNQVQYTGGEHVSIYSTSDESELAPVIYVTLDGTRYECERWYYTAFFEEEVYYGNGTIEGIDHNEDKPFLISCAKGGSYKIRYNWNFVTADTDTHTVTIEIPSETTTVYHPLDERFIPESIARTTYVDENFALKSDLENINIDLSPYETKEDAQLKYDTIVDAKADWSQNNVNAIDYVKNRTHWVEESLAEHLAETVITEVEADAQGRSCTTIQELKNVFLVVYGQTFIVTFDGVQYRCPAFSAGGNDYIGNANLLNSEFLESTTEFEQYKSDVPFLIEVILYSEEEEFWGEIIYNEWFEWNIYLKSTEVGATHTLKIEYIDSSNAIYHALDEKYIPDTIARVREIDGKMNTTNPTGTGSFSMNRLAGSTIGNYSHTEGLGTTASDTASHAEGRFTIASGDSSHAEGSYVTASGNYSHAEGWNTIASRECQHVQGRFNIEDTGDKYAHIVGNGNSNGRDVTRSNAHTLDWDGNAWYAGTIKVGGTSYNTASEVALKSDLDKKANVNHSHDDLATTIYVDSTFARKEDVQDVDLSNYYNKTEIDNLELITVDDIDTICSATIQVATASAASEVTF